MSNLVENFTNWRLLLFQLYNKPKTSWTIFIAAVKIPPGAPRMSIYLRDRRQGGDRQGAGGSRERDGKVGRADKKVKGYKRG